MLALPSLNLSLSSSFTTSREMLSQFSTCSGWIRYVFRNVKWCFNASWGLIMFHLFETLKARAIFRFTLELPTVKNYIWYNWVISLSGTHYSQRQDSLTPRWIFIVREKYTFQVFNSPRDDISLTIRLREKWHISFKLLHAKAKITDISATGQVKGYAWLLEQHN